MATKKPATKKTPAKPKQEQPKVEQPKPTPKPTLKQRFFTR